MIKLGDKVRIVDIGGELVNSSQYAYENSIYGVGSLNEDDVEKEGTVLYIMPFVPIDGSEVYVIKLDNKSVIMFEDDEFQDGSTSTYFELI